MLICDINKEVATATTGELVCKASIKGALDGGVPSFEGHTRTYVRSHIRRVNRCNIECNWLCKAISIRGG